MDKIGKIFISNRYNTWQCLFWGSTLHNIIFLWLLRYFDVVQAADGSKILNWMISSIS